MEWNLLKTIRQLNDSTEPDDNLVEAEALPSAVVDDKTLLERQGVDIADLVRPDGFVWEQDHCKLGDQYTRTIYINKLPSAVQLGWLDDITSFPYPIEVGIYVYPRDIKKVRREYRTQIARDQASIDLQLEKGRPPKGDQQQRLLDLEAFVHLIETSQTKPYHLMVIVTLRADSLEKLNRVCQEFEEGLVSMESRRAHLMQKEGLETTAPLMRNELARSDLKIAQPIQTQGLMAMFPLHSGDLTHETGVLYGLAQASGTPVIMDRFNSRIVSSPNMAVFATTGSGKSFLMKLESTQQLALGRNVIWIDPSGEHEYVANELGMPSIRIALDSHHHINPLDFSYAVARNWDLRDGPEPNALLNKTPYVIELLRTMLRTDRNAPPAADHISQAIFDKAMTHVYRKYGYDRNDVDTQRNATPDRMPVMQDVVEVLRRIENSERDPMYADRAKALIASLERFVGTGPYAGLFNHRTNVDLNAPYVVFNVASLQDEVLVMGMHSVLEYLRTRLFTEQRARHGGNRTLIYVDEAQRLMQFSETAHFLNYTAKTCRKYGVAVTVISPDVEPFVKNADGSVNPVGRGIINACASAILLQQHAHEVEHLQEIFRLTESETIRLAAARRAEGLLICGRQTVWFSSDGMASPFEYQMFTTDPGERSQIEAARRGEAPVAELRSGDPEDDVDWGAMGFGLPRGDA